MSNEMALQVDQIGLMIRTIRGQKVMLDSDLARIYGLPTKVLNQAVKRNAKRFPPDFLFQLTKEEVEMEFRSRSQFVTLKRGTNIKYLPYAFTENGSIMAANVLNSPQAVRMSVFVVRVPPSRDPNARPAGQHQRTGQTIGRTGKETDRPARQA